MANAGMFGSHFVSSRTWRPQICLSPSEVFTTPPGAFAVDPYLPTVSVDPFNPAGAVVIPIGRFVGIGSAQNVNTGSNGYRLGAGFSGRTTITIADGRYLAPCGISINSMYKQGAEEFLDSDNSVKYAKHGMVEVPFVLSVNNAHGALFSGDRVTAYWGSTTSVSTISYAHKGKPVKWNAKTLYSVSGTASAAWQLSAAIYPGIQPRVVALFDNAGVAVKPTESLAWDSNFGLWIANYTGTGSSVYAILYEHGQDADQICGEVSRIQSIYDMLQGTNGGDFLKWVEYAPADFLNFPPAAQRFPTTAVSQETPTTVTANVSYRVVSYPMSVHHAVTVEVTGVTITDSAGSSATYAAGTWFTLPNSTVTDNRNQFIGLYHNVNWRTGLIELAPNVAAGSGFDIRVSYSYITNVRDGAAIWGEGVIGLTDGRNVPTGQVGASSTTNPYGAANTLTPSTTPYGTPAHLNYADVVGALRVWVY